MKFKRALTAFSSLVLLIGSFSCTRREIPVEEPIAQQLQESLNRILEHDPGHREEKLLLSRQIDSLARTNPEKYADYLVAANALAAPYRSDLEEWEYYISRGEKAYDQVKDFLSEKYILQTKILLRYERCRKMDVMGDVNKALLCYEEVWRELPATHPDAEYLLRFKQSLPISIAYLYQFTGFYKRAEDWIGILQKNLDEDDGIYSGLNFHLKGKINEILGNFAAAKKNFVLAHAHYSRSTEGKRSGFLIENIMHYSNLLLNLGQVDSAYLVLDEVLKNGPFVQWNQVFLQYQQAKVYLARDQAGVAVEYGRQALQQAEQTISGKNYWKARILAVIGESLAGNGLWETALDTLQKALTHLSREEILSRRSFNPDPRSSDTKLDLLKVLVLKAGTLRKYYNSGHSSSLNLLEASLDTYQSSIDLIKILREEYHDDEVKEYLSQSSFSTFEAALQTALQLYSRTEKTAYLHEAFSFFENSKALSLFENLKEIEARALYNLSEDLMQRETDLKYKIATLEMNIRDMSDSPTRSELQDLLSVARGDYEDLIDSLEEKHPEYFNLKYNSKTIGLTEIQDLLSPEESLVEFFYGEHHIYTFLVTPAGWKVFTTRRTEDFEATLEGFIQNLSSRRGLNNSGKISQYLKTGYYLYQQLLEPLNIQSEKLIIIPDDILNLLPFSALPTDTNFTADPKKLPYLLHKHSIRRNFSASVWRQQEFNPVKKKNKAGSILVIAPEKFPNDSELSLDPEVLRSTFNNEVQIETNPQKERVRKLFNQGFDKIFIFTHASAKGADPYLQLLNDSLFLNELYVTQITANLVLLSACETGLGKNRKGEGVLSLGRGFAYQNVPNTIMTLWKVQDSAALWISMEMLKLHVFAGLPPSEALRRAQIKLLNDPMTTGTPFYWAGFVCTGR